MQHMQNKPLQFLMFGVAAAKKEKTRSLTLKYIKAYYHITKYCWDVRMQITSITIFEMALLMIKNLVLSLSN